MNTKFEVTNLLKPILDLLKFGKDELSNILQEGVHNYLNVQADKFYFVNNFLHRTSKVKFLKYYYPISATYKALTTNFSNLNDVFEEYKYIQLIGQAGSGKSTLVNYLFLKSFKDLKRIPILVELRNLNSYEGSLEDYITEKILQLDVKPSTKILQRELKKGKFLILLDGYDEIFSTSLQKIDIEINRFCERYSNNYILITTRPGKGYDFREGFYSFLIEPLKKNEIFNFIDLQIVNDLRKKELEKVINDSSNEDYLEYLSNPLLLSMFLLAFESHPEIPKRKSAFYRNVFDTLYSKHDGITKSSFAREKKSGLQREDFENILSIFSYILQLEGQYMFTEEYIIDKISTIKEKYISFDSSIEDILFDLRTTISILIKEGFEYKFPHRSLQEYFAALFISRLSLGKKQKAYAKLGAAITNNSKDQSNNLYRLCLELDEYSFEKYFYLPVLKQSIKHFNGKSNEELLLNFLKFARPNAFLSHTSSVENVLGEKILGKRKKTLVLFFGNISLEYNLCFSFRQKLDEHNLMLFFGRRKLAIQKNVLNILKDEIKKNESTESATRIMAWDIENVDLNNILIENGMIEIITSYRENLIQAIDNIDRKIDNYSKNLDELF